LEGARTCQNLEGGSVNSLRVNALKALRERKESGRREKSGEARPSPGTQKTREDYKKALNDRGTRRRKNSKNTEKRTGSIPRCHHFNAPEFSEREHGSEIPWTELNRSKGKSKENSGKKNHDQTKATP